MATRKHPALEGLSAHEQAVVLAMKDAMGSLDLLTAGIPNARLPTVVTRAMIVGLSGADWASLQTGMPSPSPEEIEAMVKASLAHNREPA